MRHTLFNEKTRALNLIRVERLKRLLFIKWYVKRLIYKSALGNKKLTKNQRLFTNFKMTFFTRYSSVIQQNTRCFVSGRAHMAFRFSLLARMHLRNIAKQGYIPHLSKYVI